MLEESEQNLIEGALYDVSGESLGGENVGRFVEYPFCMFTGIEKILPQEIMPWTCDPWLVFGCANSSGLYRVRIPERDYAILQGRKIKSEIGVYSSSIYSGKSSPNVVAFMKKFKELTDKLIAGDEEIRKGYDDISKVFAELSDTETALRSLESKKEDLRRKINGFDSTPRVETSIALIKRGLNLFKN